MALKDRRFMVDEEMLELVVGYAGLQPGDAVLEVGAGSGNLTEKIAEKVRVTAIEKEPDLIPILRRKFDGDDRVTLLQGDALTVEYPLYNKIVSNLPYSISRKLLERLIVEGFELAVLVVQREFAEKVAAPPSSGNYRMVSALAQSTCEVEVLDEIRPQAFKPQPRVSSSVLRLRQRWRPPPDYLGFLRRLFSLKNKKMRNILDDVPEGYGQMRPAEMQAEDLICLYQRL
ncbi:MAG: ribosomal RNA small subunit methyltransferase A [Candidatus Altiarchaeales archaeon]|nr:ribosomal RNA small subunit methyltransferase A [Candidatus Altiarchaeales archaeon]MBD3416928.1 ribosomal RNA small subunit methyltransferase A [Candidatus Altiarchaeales archaeon]